MKGMKCWFTVEGLNIERFVRKTAAAGISLSQMKKNGRKLHALVNEDEIHSLQELASQGGWNFTADGKAGAGRCMDAAKHRRGFMCALLACAILLVIALQLVWHVDVTGAAIYRSDAERFLQACGVHAFVWKHDVDLAELRDTLEWRYPDVAWVDCGWRGTTLRIDLVQGVPQGETITREGCGDVVASRGGVIESIVTLAGTAMVQPGNVVQPGQVLIAGQERGAEEAVVPVMARGKVLARVWDQASAQMNITETETVYTGAEQEVWTVVCPWFPLWKIDEFVYEIQDVTRTTYPVGGLFFPFLLRKDYCAEAEMVKRTRTIAEMEAETGEAALRLLRNKIGIHDELVDKWVDYCMIEDEILCATAYGERLIDIAESRRNAP